MKKIPLGKSGIAVSEISLGLMRLHERSLQDATALIRQALELGIDFFDHADIYGSGECERIFGRILREEGIRRDSILLQSKCGIRPGAFDFSKGHILSSVDGILKRLGTDYLDVLLLHRPDTLMEPEEVAEAFDHLHASGQVRHFGVSNQNPMQMRLLQKHLNQDLVANQLQLSLTNTGMIDSGLNVNTRRAAAVDHDGGVLEFCRLHDITIQTWSPLQHGWFEGPFIDNRDFPELNSSLAEIGEAHGVTKTAIAIAWLLRHPARMQSVVGTTSVPHLTEICAASTVSLSRDEWYRLYRAAGNTLP